MSKEQIKALIGHEESQVLERKQSLNLQREALESLCGMLNADTAEGTVVFGVSCDGRLVGVEPGDLDRAQRSLAQAIGNKFDPPVQTEMRVEELEGKRLVVLSAHRRCSVAYHEYDGRAFIREGTATRQLSLAEKQALQRTRNRDAHPGPWKCDRCGSWVGMLVSVVFTEKGPQKSYSCMCGGEYWPAA